jgi:hypothetical protein
MCFSSKNGFKYFNTIAEGDTTIVNFQLSIVNYYRANGTINWNLKCIRHYLGMVMVTTIWFSVSRCSETAAMPPVRMR